jgi:hypothetical protein
MNEGQRGRKIGNGVKPPGNKRATPQMEPNELIEQSTNEGQPDPTLEPVLEPQEGNETPGNLETGKFGGITPKFGEF